MKKITIDEYWELQENVIPLSELNTEKTSFYATKVVHPEPSK